jgi:hypothetical protein
VRRRWSNARKNERHAEIVLTSAPS